MVLERKLNLMHKFVECQLDDQSMSKLLLVLFNPKFLFIEGRIRQGHVKAYDYLRSFKFHFSGD